MSIYSSVSVTGGQADVDWLSDVMQRDE